jgi:hypothetical protein
MNGSGPNEAFNNNDVVNYKKIMMAKANVEKADIKNADTENANTEKTDSENAESSSGSKSKKRKDHEEVLKDDSSKTKCQKKRKMSTHEVASTNDEDLVQEVILLKL